ncbi:hypothetical protein B0H63DRAFT_473391 [Podospora didyma]|uniref:Uncharacterized protein n=1 Tax=Podospora didyma TaxID=330526 RepID=A0AAE0TZV8_9PEZI|nr:hypothetical protein B0H63DRAFT_473391 [Podospora didyma]
MMNPESLLLSSLGILLISPISLLTWLLLLPNTLVSFLPFFSFPFFSPTGLAITTKGLHLKQCLCCESSRKLFLVVQ